jgi:predicted transcriptional regulator
MGNARKPPARKSTAVRIDEDVRHQADLYATKNRRRLKAVIEEAVVEYLKSRKAWSNTRTL